MESGYSDTRLLLQMDVTHGRKLIGCLTELGFSQEEEEYNINLWKLNNHANSNK